MGFSVVVEIILLLCRRLRVAAAVWLLNNQIHWYQLNSAPIMWYTGQTIKVNLNKLPTNRRTEERQKKN